MNIIDMVESQVIATIKNEESIDLAIKSQSNIAFLLTGDLTTCSQYTSRLKAAGMHVFIHLDFIDGLANTKSAVQYIASEWKPTGIISTKSSLIKFAKDEGLMTIQRIFLIDRAAVNKGIEMSRSCKPDAIEVLPGIMPKIIEQLSQEVNLPLIVGGLITEKHEIMTALESGALAVSTGNPTMWNFDL
jgi:glycerol uptake operon antiterminator